MQTFTFKHGIHPPTNKEKTNKKPIKTIEAQPGDLLTFPMSQHIGAPCQPEVSIGERVLHGQKIADSPALVSSPVFSSVSGIVKEIKQIVTPTGITSDAIIIENDGENEVVDKLTPRKDFLGLTKEDYLGIIRGAGIVGLGGAGFPTHVKLNPPLDKKIDTILINASACEPYLTADHRIMAEAPETIANGLKIVLRMFPDAKGVIGIEANMPDAIKSMKDACSGDERIRIMPLEPKYPQGSEKQLIYSCLNRQVPSGGLPADIGCIVLNADTAASIDRAVRLGRPLTRKVVTIAGGAINDPGNFKVPMGMSYARIVEFAGGMNCVPKKMISGGPMMGVALYTLDLPVIKTSSALLCFTEKETVVKDEHNCIRCGRCVDHCPMRLLPLELNKYAIRYETDLFIKNNGMDCMECGSCSYICPSKRHLTQSIRTVRRHILAQKKK